MISTFRGLLAIACIMSACSCAKLPEPVALDMPTNAVVIPEFSGGPGGAVIDKKKAALVAAYEALAQAEKELDRKRIEAMTFEAGSTFGGHFGRSTPSTQRTLLTKGNRSIAAHQASIAQLRRELTQAGVIVTLTRG